MLKTCINDKNISSSENKIKHEQKQRKVIIKNKNIYKMIM